MPAKRAPAKKAVTKQAAANKSATEKATPAKRVAKRSTGPARRARPFPALPFEEALVLGQAIQQHAAGQRVRRLTLFDNMGRPADALASRSLVTASNQYGITTGSYAAEYLELTPDGRLATAEDIAAEDRFRARFRLAVENNQWFRHLYENFRDSRVPAAAVLADSVTEAGLGDVFVTECVETFIVNAKFLGLLRPVAGAERLLTVEYVVEDLQRSREYDRSESTVAGVAPTMPATPATSPGPTQSLDDVCFYITPIGHDDSEERQHADLFMGALLEPVLGEFNLRLVRADQIAEPGLITAQIIEHVVNCPLVVADLSYHNPNVFYELALRHAVRKPIVQLIRQADRIPFDLQQFRTIVIDTTNIYSLVPRLDTYRTEVASQIRVALDSPAETGNPLTAFYPGFWDALPR